MCRTLQLLFDTMYANACMYVRICTSYIHTYVLTVEELTHNDRRKLCTL